MTQEKRIIASLTTYGTRVNTVHIAIESILNQTLKANKVILWLAEDEFQEKSIPESLKKLQDRGLEINFCEDLKSYKKLIPSLKKYPNDLIITFDDDILYKNDIIEILYNSYLKEPDAIHCIRGHRINFSSLTKVSPYEKWDKQHFQNTSSLFIIPTGAGGVLYPPNSLHQNVHNTKTFLSLASTTDDIWFKIMSLKKRTKCKVLSNANGYSNNLQTIKDTQKDSLWSKNKINNTNDLNFEKLYTKYNINNILSKDIVLSEIYSKINNAIHQSENNKLVFLSKNIKSDVQVLNEFEKEISKYNENKKMFWKIYKYLHKQGYESFAQISLLRYLSYKCVKFKNSIKKYDKKTILLKYKILKTLIEKSQTKDIFLHYIDVFLLLNNVDIKKYSSINLNTYLKKIGWLHKKNLYERLINKLVKINKAKTNTSVVVISNGTEIYIYDCLKELKKQNTNNNYKIIFVSNNPENQTNKILSLVDTFIQMQENNGAYLARNVGAIFAFSQNIIFLEDDGIPQKDYVKTFINNFKDNYISMRGSCLSKTNNNMPPHYWLGFNKKPSPTLLEGNCIFKSKEFYKVGGWSDYILFGHGGIDICYRMIEENISSQKKHYYTPYPTIYHDFTHENKDLKKKLLIHKTSKRLLIYTYENFHNILEKWEK